MNYLGIGEAALLAPAIATNTRLADSARQNGYIIQASSIVDGACGGSLEILPYYDEETSLDQNLAGYLSRRPFRGWVDDTGTIFYFGNESGGSPVTLADFSVDKKSGILCDLSSGAGNQGSSEIAGFVSPAGGAYISPYLANLRQYHLGNVHVVNDNSKPYILRASYYAGYFTEKTVSESATTGADEVVLEDVRFLERGREFYFSSDVPDAEPTVDRRIKTIDGDTNTVTFTPVLGHDIAANDKFRMIDKQARAACAEIIADILTYPPNTRQYSRGLSKGDLQNNWVRMNDQVLPVGAADKLKKYARR